MRELTLAEVNEVSGSASVPVSLGAGAAIGVWDAVGTYTVLSSGALGAELGAWAGPIGVAGGFLIGAGTFYIVHKYL
jgi:hypothetical protein